MKRDIREYRVEIGKFGDFSSDDSQDQLSFSILTGNSNLDKNLSTKKLVTLFDHKKGAINDPLGQTHSLARSEHCDRLKFVLFDRF